MSRWRRFGVDPNVRLPLRFSLRWRRIIPASLVIFYGYHGVREEMSARTIRSMSLHGDERTDLMQAGDSNHVFESFHQKVFRLLKIRSSGSWRSWHAFRTIAASRRWSHSRHSFDVYAEAYKDLRWAKDMNDADGGSGRAAAKECDFLGHSQAATRTRHDGRSACRTKTGVRCVSRRDARHWCALSPGLWIACDRAHGRLYESSLSHRRLGILQSEAPASLVRSRKPRLGSSPQSVLR